MTDDEQKFMFAKNLNRYMDLNQKQQIEVAKDLGINATTLNMWCKGNSMPNVGKIQKLADYFHIGKSDLLDSKPDVDLDFSDIAMKIALNDPRFKKIIVEYNNLPNDKKNLLCEFLEKFVFQEKQG